MNKLQNSKILATVIRSLVDETADDKELQTQFGIMSSVIRDVNATVESDLLLGATILVNQRRGTRDDSYDSDDNEISECHYPKALITISTLTDWDFKTHFGVSKSTIEAISKTVQSFYYKSKCQESHRPALPMETKLLVCIWMLTTQDTYKNVCDRFNLGKGVCHRLFFEAIEILYNMIGQTIVWPEQNEWSKLQSTIQTLTGMPGVVGVIGSCHVPIKMKLGNQDLYVNSRGYTSIVLQGICTPDLKFADVCIGWPGSIGCDQIFRNSDIYFGISTNGGEFLPENGHLVGSFAFPLESFLLTPYTSTDDLDYYQNMYNAATNRCSFILQKAFSLLHQRFNRLRCVELTRLDVLPKMISAACVLHNMILEQGDNTIDVLVNDDIHYFDIVLIDQQNPLSSSAKMKRDEIARSLS